MTFGSRNRALGVAGTRIIIFNGLLGVLGVFCLFGERRKQGKNKDGKEEQDSKEGCVKSPTVIQTPKLARAVKPLALPENISRAASRTTGLVRKFEEYKQLKKITKLSPKPGSSTQLLWKSGQHFGYSNGFGSQALWFLSLEMIYIRNSNQECTVCQNYYFLLDSTA